MEALQVIGIVVSLVLLIFIAYQGLPIMPTYTEKAVTYVKNFFPVFMLGAVFGKIMEESGMAKSIAHAILLPRIRLEPPALYKEANIPKKLVTHRQSYHDIFVITILTVAMVVIALGFVAIFGIA